ncbi:MAG: Fur family transcriptional regulator [Proteobacteria bacterium]|nr:Fur family transcriptional regulator [Pseudomonadota bacterium]
MLSQIEKLCAEKNINLTENRRIIAQVICDSDDHPDVEEVFKRVSKIKPQIGIATVYRTVKMFAEEGIITKHDFGEGRARYEEISATDHHDHLIDINSGKVIEFFNDEIEELKERIAKDLGYKLVDHRLELYAVPLNKDK